MGNLEEIKSSFSNLSDCVEKCLHCVDCEKCDEAELLLDEFMSRVNGINVLSLNDEERRELTSIIRSAMELRKRISGKREAL
ncbi:MULTISPECIES: hypothetical protein [Acidianus]|uniref:Uncharacterized protein n=1 Tax=Candidatus Acidianus copahuensis TaxID=1160895 RepID=A0A031LX59_9CREN|nr:MULTISPECIES: hypothetical protein [Acidianus]EZQ12059.1 hypothetical protein CM19_00310 [Candidatus Acidianus copahuensis]NON63059.1 hypothetical protein [Acidianus sp. RZ1]